MASVQGGIAILGVFVADTTFRADRLPRMGETLLGKTFALGPGGKGSNQAVGCARLEAPVHLVSTVGDDAFADLAFRVWAEAGVTPIVRRRPDVATGAAFIYVDDASGDNAIIICPGAAGTLDVADVEAAAETIRGAAVFMTQLEQPLAAARRGLEIARAAGVRTILNPAPAAPLDDALLGLCDVVTPNASEAAALTGIDVTDRASAAAAARALIARGAAAAVVTLGADGAIIANGGGDRHMPAKPAGPVVETTGAGDAFNAGLAVALSEDHHLDAAVGFGCAVAGVSVTRAGTAASMPRREDVATVLSA